MAVARLLYFVFLFSRTMLFPFSFPIVYSFSFFLFFFSPPLLVANSRACCGLHILFARVFIAVGIAPPNHLVV